MKKKISILVIALVAVISVVGVVSAQDTTQTPAPLTSLPILPSTSSANAPVMQQLLQIVATDLDMQPQDLLQQLRGQSLADIIKAKNGDTTKITADVTAAVTTAVNQAVTDGKLTQDRATQVLTNLPTTIQNALNGTGMGRGGFGGFAGRGNAGGGRGNAGGGRGNGSAGPGQGLVRPDMLGEDARPLLKAVQDATKLTPQQIAQEMRSKSETLSQVISAHGGDPAAVETAALATATQNLDKFRTNGTLTQDQEDAMVNGLKAFYDAVLNGEFRQQQVTPESTTAAPV